MMIGVQKSYSETSLSVFVSTQLEDTISAIMKSALISQLKNASP